LPFRMHDGRVASFPQAIAYYEQALIHDPNSVVDLLSLGNCYRNAGRTSKAETYFRKCVELEPACPEAAFLLAGILFEERHAPEDALHVMDNAFKHKKDWAFYRLSGETVDEFVQEFDIFREILQEKMGSARRVSGRAAKHGKAGRVAPNDLCPCGSGKKYKKCCGTVA